MAQDINIKVNAQNNASPALKKVQQDIGGLDKAAGQASGGLSALGKAAGIAGIVAVGTAAASAAVELAQLGAQSLALKSSFEQVQGGAENASATLDALRSASRGMITDYDLMLAANKAALLGVADTAEEMSGLLEIASVRGRAMGISATQAFNDIVTGLGRMSPLILDNLGITVDLEKATQDYATTLGKSAKSLTDAERKQALVNAVIEQSAGLMDDANRSADTLAGQGFAQLTTAWQNFRTTVGEGLAGPLDAAAAELAAFLVDARNQLDEWRTEDVVVYQPQVANMNLANAQAELDNLQQQLADKTQNAQREIQEIFSQLNPLDPDSAKNASDQYQLELDAIIAKIVEVQKQVDILTGKQEKAASRSASALARDLNIGPLADATNPQFQRTAEQNGLLDLQAQIQAQLDLYQQAIASYTYATNSGNAAAAENAKRIYTDVASVLPNLIRQYNELAKVVGSPAIVGTKFGLGEILFQSAEAFQQAQQEAENLAAAIELIDQAGSKLDGIYDTLLDTGNIEGAKKAYADIKGEIQGIVVEWIKSGESIEDIQSSLLPKLIAELDNLIGKQVEAGDAGIASGDAIGSGFLSAIPAIQTVIGIINELTGAASAAAGAVGRATQAGGNYWSPNTRGNRGNAGGLGGSPIPGASLGRGSGTGTGGMFDTLGGELSRRQAGIGGRSIGGGIGASYGGGGGGGSSVDSAANQLASRIKSVLQGALKSGIDVDALLPRQDAVEENARRLADVAVRGYDSPWAAYFQEKFPDLWAEISSGGDVKTAAAQILRDFEDGLRPELLDKDRAKELVRRAILGEQNMSNLANEIAAELSSELGISLEAAQAAASGTLGTGNNDGIGATFADGAVTGVSDSNAGGRMVTALVAQLAIKDNLDSIYTAGQSYGAQWGSGFLASVSSNVPGQLVAVLVAMVTPGVQAALAAYGGRTGATGGSAI